MLNTISFMFEMIFPSTSFAYGWRCSTAIRVRWQGAQQKRQFCFLFLPRREVLRSCKNFLPSVVFGIFPKKRSPVGFCPSQVITVFLWRNSLHFVGIQTYIAIHQNK